MPTDIYRNDQIYNMVAEGEVAQLLSHFSNSYVMDVIKNSIENRFAYNPAISNPNIVNSYELNFKDMIDTYPSDVENIMSIRQETYLNIINIICNSFNLQYIGNEPDCFILAYNLYDFLVSGYARNVINFFANYIYTNRKALYDAMGLDRYKKDKDASTNYIRKVYEDNVLAIIINRIKDVVYYIAGFDIDMYTYMTYANYNKDTIDFIYSNIAPMGNLFKDEFCRAALENASLLTDIRLAIHRLAPVASNEEETTSEDMGEDIERTEEVNDGEDTIGEEIDNI